MTSIEERCDQEIMAILKVIPILDRHHLLEIVDISEYIREKIMDLIERGKRG